MGLFAGLQENVTIQNATTQNATVQDWFVDLMDRVTEGGTGKDAYLGFVYLGPSILIFIWGFYCMRKMRALENLQLSKIRSIAMGPVKIDGKVEAFEGKLLTSPLSGRKCVYYRYDILARSGDKDITVDSGEQGIPFYLKDSTEKVLVDPKDSSITMPEKDLDENLLGSEGLPPPLRDPAVQKRMGLEGKDPEDVTFLEVLIVPKDKLYIIGTACDNPYVEDTTGQKNVDDIMVRKRGDDIFQISDAPETKERKMLKYMAIAGIFGGGIGIVLSLSILLYYFGIM